MLRNIIIAIGLVVLGFVLGATCVYILEKKIVDRLIASCEDSRDRLDKLIDEEEKFMESMWPKHNHIFMNDSLADYLKSKYLAREEEDEPDCEDEPDNLYI